MAPRNLILFALKAEIHLFMRSVDLGLTVDGGFNSINITHKKNLMHNGNRTFRYRMQEAF
jgi:hypothetical protein